MKKKENKNKLDFRLQTKKYLHFPIYFIMCVFNLKIHYYWALNHQQDILLKHFTLVNVFLFLNFINSSFSFKTQHFQIFWNMLLYLYLSSHYASNEPSTTIVADFLKKILPNVLRFSLSAHCALCTRQNGEIRVLYIAVVMHSGWSTNTCKLVPRYLWYISTSRYNVLVNLLPIDLTALR